MLPDVVILKIGTPRKLWRSELAECKVVKDLSVEVCCSDVLIIWQPSKFGLLNVPRRILSSIRSPASMTCGLQPLTTVSPCLGCSDGADIASMDKVPQHDSKEWRSQSALVPSSACEQLKC